MSDDYTDAPDHYWEQDAMNERDDWDLHLRHWEKQERDRLTRDAGESGDHDVPPLIPAYGLGVDAVQIDDAGEVAHRNRAAGQQRRRIREALERARHDD